VSASSVSDLTMRKHVAHQYAVVTSPLKAYRAVLDPAVGRAMNFTKSLASSQSMRIRGSPLHGRHHSALGRMSSTVCSTNGLESHSRWPRIPYSSEIAFAVNRVCNPEGAEPGESRRFTPLGPRPRGPPAPGSERPDGRVPLSLICGFSPCIPSMIATGACRAWGVTCSWPVPGERSSCTAFRRKFSSSAGRQNRPRLVSRMSSAQYPCARVGR
jgi:hypothetical protein